MKVRLRFTKTLRVGLQRLPSDEEYIPAGFLDTALKLVCHVAGCASYILSGLEKIFLKRSLLPNAHV